MGSTNRNIIYLWVFPVKKTLCVCAILFFGVDSWMIIPIMIVALWKLWNVDDEVINSYVDNSTHKKRDVI